MDWLLVAGSAVLAWVSLCVISGERQRRVQQREIRRRRAESNAVETPITLM